VDARPAGVPGRPLRGADYDKVDDILDVWFESGCTHAFVLERRPDELRWPADVYLEGSDQHRGWFQSSLLESCGTRGRAPFGTVLTHGFVMDAQGRKMSKSLGNTVSPADLLKTHGADILRLWVVSADYTEDLRIGKEILDGVGDSYRACATRCATCWATSTASRTRAAAARRDAGAGAVGAAPPGRAGRVGSRVQRELRLPAALRRAAQLLRHRPLRLLLRRPQGQPLLRPGRGDDAAGGADRCSTSCSAA
jgi:cysteinyl-tRNA synthetase